LAIHEFTPDRYYSTLGAHPPVLTIAPGDTVRTTTVDAAGDNERYETVGGRPNPQTGPFFIEGAEPGDTLVVRFDVIRPNRETGWTNGMLAPNVVDPDFVASMGQRDRITWTVDMEGGIAYPVDPIRGLERLRLPVDPMLGSFGVAARGGQAITTFTSAEHGGNMDYRGFRAGVTAYLPVFAPGALFFLGDGHATQGDGEIVGTGIEISMDVEFTVDLRKGETICWPRGENEREIFTVGNARPLDQALQHATTEMTRWLMRDYGLDAGAAATVLGQCVEYDIANVYDPAYSVACKVPKAMLAMVGTRK
jgi:acetamidase/formamidase